MSDTEPIFDFEHNGYRFLAEDDPEGKKGEARVRIFKGIEVVRSFGWPAYKIWNIQAHADDIVEGLKGDRDDGLRLAGSTGMGGSVYNAMTITERLSGAAGVIERATAHNYTTGNPAMPEDTDEPEGTLIVKMSDTIRKGLAKLLRDAAMAIRNHSVGADDGELRQRYEFVTPLWDEPESLDKIDAPDLDALLAAMIVIDGQYEKAKDAKWPGPQRWIERRMAAAAGAIWDTTPDRVECKIERVDDLHTRVTISPKYPGDSRRGQGGQL